MDTLLKSVSGRGVATLTFNRPDRANSYNAEMLDALADGFEQFGRDSAVRIIVLRGGGKHFSAGAAIGESGQPKRAIGDVCALVDATPKPTIAVVQGACIGGALALASCCDVMVASREAFFSIPEVRLGFAPGPLIGSFLRAIGYRALRRYLLSGERFTAEEAHRLGLVQQLCDAPAIDSVADELIDQLLLGAPGRRGERQTPPAEAGAGRAFTRRNSARCRRPSRRWRSRTRPPRVARLSRKSASRAGIRPARSFRPFIRSPRNPEDAMAKKPIVVDFHAHILEPHVLKASAGRTVVTGFGAIAEPPRTPGSRRDIWFKQMMDPEAHLEGLAKMGVDVSVISSSTVIQNTAWADASTGLELDRRCNDMIADWVRRYPGPLRRHVHDAVEGPASLSSGDGACGQAAWPSHRQPAREC